MIDLWDEAERENICTIKVKMTQISHRKFTNHIDVIRNELLYRHINPPMYHTGYESESIEFYHPKWENMVVMQIVKTYENGEFVKKYYENTGMVELISHYIGIKDFE